MSKGIYRITHQRKIFNTDGDRSTISELFPDGKFFCYACEDECRFDGEKVFGETAIPAIEYDVVVTWSPKFKREMILLHNKPDLSIQYEGVKFTGVRVHNGKTAKNSHGCPCVGKETDGIKVWTPAEAELTKIVKQKIAEGYNVKWLIQLKPFSSELNNTMV